MVRRGGPSTEDAPAAASRGADRSAPTTGVAPDRPAAAVALDGVAEHGGNGAGARLSRLSANQSLRLSVAPWLVARVVVIGALALSHLVVDRTHPTSAGVATRVHAGLLGWDAGWYEAIAEHGYGSLARGSLRFFPLVPMAARAVAWLPGIGAGTALVLLANVSAFVGTCLLVQLVRSETGDTDLARRSAWLLSLAPSAFVLVMGYAEATLLVLCTACFLALRRSSGERPPAWGWVAGLGVAAGLTRPLGVLLVLPAAWEAWRWWGRSSGARRAASLVGTAGPVVGTVIFLAWSAGTFGDFWAPLREQTTAGRHGGLSDPVRSLLDDARGALHGHVGTGLHVPWVVVVVALLVLVWIRLPAAYGLFATGVVAAAISGTNLDSFERYALSAFPLVVAAATLTASSRVERVVLIVMGAGLAGYAVLAFMNLSVP